MKQIVIMPGGFHPFHAGHAALYHSAVKAFPNADVYVAATNDTKTRPFPFSIKEKLAKLAGVAPGKFVQVKSPFQPREITDHFNPAEDVVIFVRSEKDKNESPKPGGTKKDGSPAYFQPWTGKDVQPFGKQAYMAYLPTVEFGPGIKSATEIRNAWPKLDDRRKTAMVMSLYPATQKNPKLAANVVKMLDMGMGGQVDEGKRKKKKKSSKSLRGYFFPGYAYYGGSESSEGGSDGGGGESVDNMTEGPYVQRIVHPKRINLFVRMGKGSRLIASDIPYEILDRYIDKVVSKYPQFSKTDFSFNTADKAVAESDDPWGDQGNFAGDKPVNIGGSFTKSKLGVGDMVRVNAGHYKGLGEIEAIKGDQAKVWMDNYGRSFVFDLSDLVKYIPESIDYLEEK